MTTYNIPSGIRGVSEERRTPRLGKIRLGIQVPNKSGKGTHPEMSPYFVFDGDTAAGAALYEHFGDQCTEIPVAFPSDDPSEFARRNLEMWGAGTLKCRGNGVEALALVDPAAFGKYRAAAEKAQGAFLPVPENVWRSTARAGNDDSEPVREVIPCAGLGYDGQPPCVKFANGKDCKATMHLQVIVRGFPGLGIFQIDTSSVVNIQRLDDFLAYLGNFTGGRFAMVPLVMRLEPYDMRGRKYYGLTFAVDFAAMQAEGIGALPGVSQMSIPERVVRFLPAETAQPAPAALLAGPADGDDAPSDGGSVDVLTGEIVEDEAPDDGDEEAPEPLGEERMNAAVAWLDACAESASVKRSDILTALNADIVQVASNLAAYQAQWAAFERNRQAAAAPAPATRTAPAASGPSKDGVKARPMLLAWAKQSLGLNTVQLLDLVGASKNEDLDEIAEKEGGWPQAAAFIESLAQPAGVSS